MRQFNCRHSILARGAGVFTALVVLALAAFSATAQDTVESVAPTSTLAKPLVVAIVISPGASLLDFAGPAEVFRVAPGRPLEYFVSEHSDPLKLQNGMIVMPSYTFDTAPAADIVVVGSQNLGASTKALTWLRRVHALDHTIMSVCTGVDWLGQAGLLDGLEATTHHNAFDSFAQKFAAVKVVRGRRYVRSDTHLFTAAGYTAGIDLALHLIDLQFGRDAATAVAAKLEYKGDGWISNE